MIIAFIFFKLLQSVIHGFYNCVKIIIWFLWIIRSLTNVHHAFLSRFTQLHLTSPHLNCTSPHLTSPHLTLLHPYLLFLSVP